MEPERRKIVNGKLVEEFYWNGKLVVYVDNTLSKLSYDEIN